MKKIRDIGRIDDYCGMKLRQDLAAVGDADFMVKVNSPGGSIIIGADMYNDIKNHNGKTLAVVSGMAASMGSYILGAFDEVHIEENSYIMIHDPWGGVTGTSEILDTASNLLKMMRGDLAKTYARMTGETVEKIREYMKAETWFSAKQAKKMGFASKVIPQTKQVEKGEPLYENAYAIAARTFKNAPDFNNIKNSNTNDMADETKTLTAQEKATWFDKIFGNKKEDAQNELTAKIMTLETEASAQVAKVADLTAKLATATASLEAANKSIADEKEARATAENSLTTANASVTELTTFKNGITETLKGLETTEKFGAVTAENFADYVGKIIAHNKLLGKSDKLKLETSKDADGAYKPKNEGEKRETPKDRMIARLTSEGKSEDEIKAAVAKTYG